MVDRCKLLKQIQMYEFAINDVVLFLDSHPTNKNALSYYEKHRDLHQEAVKRYEAMYGPLTVFGNQNCNYWTWVNNPWPWELEA